MYSLPSKTLFRALLRWCVRLLCVVAAVFFAAGGPLPAIVARVLPALSPLVVAADTLAGRHWYAGLYWALPAIGVLLLAVFQGRFFCRWICPTGTLFALASPIALKRRLPIPRLSGVLFWTIAFGAIAGLPLLLSIDPLSSGNRLTVFIKGWTGVAALIPGLLVPAMLLLSLIQPMVWCTHLCPLGYAFELVHRRSRHPLVRRDPLRRDLAIGLVLGVPLAILGRRVRFRTAADTPEESPPPVLPPGADTADRFAALCTRCYACVNVCPTRAITVPLPAGRKLSQMFQPELNALVTRTYCEEFCNACSQVCPTGALRPLSVDEKRTRKIGTAKVIRHACLAWTDHQHCMVCDEFCPYLAIETDLSPEGLPRPVVNEEICRGCGICVAKCPAKRGGCAIVVTGADPQTTAKQFSLSEALNAEETS